MKNLVSFINEKLVINKNIKLNEISYDIINTLLNEPEENDSTDHDWSLRGYIGEFIRATYDWGTSKQILIKDRMQSKYMPLINNTKIIISRPKKIIFKKRLDFYTSYYEDIKRLLSEIQNDDSWNTVIEDVGVQEKILFGVSSDEKYCVIIHYDENYEQYSAGRYIYNLMIGQYI